MLKSSAMPNVTVHEGYLDWLESLALHLHVEVLDAHVSDALVEQASGTLQLHPIVDANDPAVVVLEANADLVEHVRL